MWLKHVRTIINHPPVITINRWYKLTIPKWMIYDCFTHVTLRLILAIKRSTGVTVTTRKRLISGTRLDSFNSCRLGIWMVQPSLLCSPKAPINSPRSRHLALSHHFMAVEMLGSKKLALLMEELNYHEPWGYDLIGYKRGYHQQYGDTLICPETEDTQTGIL